MAQKIENPRRILAVSLEQDSSLLHRVISDLTKNAPQPVDGTLAGISHTLALSTPYYTADISVWLDLVDSPADWASTFLSEEAQEVLQALGGIVIVFPVAETLASEGPSPTAASASPIVHELVEKLGDVVRQGLGGWSWEGCALAVGVSSSGNRLPVELTEAWEDVCTGAGLEFVAVHNDEKPEERNEFGEKVGMARVLEALETTSWSATDGDGDDEMDQGDQEVSLGENKPPSLGELDDLDFVLSEPLDSEELRQALWNGGPGGEEKPLTEADVQRLEDMVNKLRVTKEAIRELPDGERRRMARHAVEDVMRDFA